MQKTRDQSVTVPVLVKCPATAKECKGMADQSPGHGDWQPVRVFRDDALSHREREMLASIAQAFNKNRLTLADAYQRLGRLEQLTTPVALGAEEKRAQALELRLLRTREEVAPRKGIHPRTLALVLAEALRRTKLVPWWDDRERIGLALLCDDITTAIYIRVQLGKTLKICKRKGCGEMFTGKGNYHSRKCGARDRKARERQHLRGQKKSRKAARGAG